METVLIPWGDSKRIHDVLKYRGEKESSVSHFTSLFFVFKYLYLLRTCCNVQSMDTGNGLYGIYQLISNKFGHFHKFCGNFPLILINVYVASDFVTKVMEMCKYLERWA